MGIQRHNISIKNRLSLVKIALVLCVAVVIGLGCFLPQDVTIYTHESFATLDQGWAQLVGQDTIALETIQQYMSLEPTDPLIIQRTITSDMVDQCVVFYAEHQEVFAWVDDTLVYSLRCPETLAIFGTLGRAWVSIPITSDMVGQQLCLQFETPFAIYQGLPSQIFCVAQSSIYAVQVDFLLVRNTIALLMLVLAVVSYINAILWTQPRMRRFLFSIADVYLFVGLWLCAEVNVLAIWFGRAPISAILAMIFSRMIPVAFYHFFLSILPYTSWRTKLAGLLVWGNLLVSLALQFVFGISLLHLVALNIAVIVLSCLLGLVEIGYYHGSGLAFLTYGHACYWTALLFLASLLECVLYVQYQSYGQWMGVPLCLACVVYYVITHVFLVSTQSATAQEKDRLEQVFFNLHKKPLNQQINAHFLYNSLNTISAYCKEAPDQAYEAIRLLGQYMRAYTTLLGTNDYVPLEEELDLMQTYMAIQNMRFEGRIRFSVHNTCDDVRLPPLTLQPLVENAVNHGIRKGNGCGDISITTCYKYNMAQIMVSDTGIGFDVTRLSTSAGVGLANLTHRIKAMGGSLRLESTPGAGTTAILMVPVEHSEQEDAAFEDFICGR